MSFEIEPAFPSCLSHLVGQKAVIAQVRTAVDAAFEDRSRFDHALLVGSPGLGKSQLASIIAQEMAVEFHEVLGQSITSIGDLNALLLEAKDDDIIPQAAPRQVRLPSLRPRNRAKWQLPTTKRIDRSEHSTPSQGQSATAARGNESQSIRLRE